MKIQTIYSITNTTNGKTYIGKTNNLRKRCSAHFSECPTAHSALTEDVKKYGCKVFVVEVLAKAYDQIADKIEDFFINQIGTLHPNGYNKCGGGNKGKSVSEATLQSLREAQRKRFSNPEEKRKLSEAQLKRFKDPEARKKLSEAQKKKPITKAWLEQLKFAREARKNKMGE